MYSYESKKWLRGGYIGSKQVVTLAPGVERPALYEFLIRDRDVTLVKIYLGGISVKS